MACACKNRDARKATYTVTFPDGSTKSYRSEIEAKRQVALKGGKYEKK
jgi:hypothetical protein